MNPETLSNKATPETGPAKLRSEKSLPWLMMGFIGLTAALLMSFVSFPLYPLHPSQDFARHNRDSASTGHILEVSYQHGAQTDEIGPAADTSPQQSPVVADDSGPTPDPVISTPADHQLRVLQDEIIKARTDRLEQEAKSVDRQTAGYLAARHREELLELSYSGMLATLSPDRQRAAQVALLRREAESRQRLYKAPLDRPKEQAKPTPANGPRIATSPQRKLEITAGIALGILFGIGLFSYRKSHQEVILNPGDAGRHLHVPELGVVPSSKSLASFSDSREPGGTSPRTNGEGYDDASNFAEACRSVALSTLLADWGKGIRSYLITSPSPGDGKTTLIAHLGIALSKSRLRVVLVDANLRRPRLHELFGLPNGHGLRDILRGEIDLDEAPTELLVHQTWSSNIAVVTAGEGPGDAVELLHTSYSRHLLKRLTRDFDIVLIDSPPILDADDARVLATQTNGAILVLRANQTKRNDAARALAVLNRDGIPVVGTILNGFDELCKNPAGYYSSSHPHQAFAEAAKQVTSNL